MRKTFAWILLEIFVLTACAPMTKFIPTITPSPTLESLSQGWSTFRNEKFGFSFQYPAVYDKGFQSLEFTCNISVGENDTNNLSVSIGDIRVIAEETSTNLSQYTNYYIKNRLLGWDVKQTEIKIDGSSANRLEYHRESPARSGSATIIVRENKAIIIQYFETNFLYCDLKDDGYSSYWVYQRILQYL